MQIIPQFSTVNLTLGGSNALLQNAK